MNEILTAYQDCRNQLRGLSDLKVGGGSGWARFSESRVTVKWRAAATFAEMRERLQKLPLDPATVQGWVLWQKHPVPLEVLSWGALLQRLSDQLAPLDAESGDAMSSIALQYRRGAWHLTYIHEDEAAGSLALACDQSYLARPPAPGRMKYRVYWQMDEDDMGYRPKLARFLGFGPAKARGTQ